MACARYVEALQQSRKSANESLAQFAESANATVAMRTAEVEQRLQELQNSTKKRLKMLEEQASSFFG